MKYYAIWHKQTRQFMPAKMSRTGRYGWTHWMPGASGHEGVSTSGPRLFTKKTAADAARRQWLNGKTVMDWDRGYFGDKDPHLECIPEPGRRPDDIEVVELVLSIPIV